MRNQNKINKTLNDELHEILNSDCKDLIKPFVDKITWFMQQDSLIIGRQYISFEESLNLVNGVNYELF